MKKLTEAEIAQALQQAPGWKLDAGKMTRAWQFKDFAAAMEFVNQVAAKAEHAGHHPDIDIRYNKVTLALVTHDAGGITARDASMASELGRDFPL